jgi:hypothetical protein
MTIADQNFRRFTLENVRRAPRKGGVYALYAKRTMLFLGVATGGGDTIRRRLKAHLAKGVGGATVYKREPSDSPAERMDVILAEHIAAHGAPPRVDAEPQSPTD